MKLACVILTVLRVSTILIVLILYTESSILCSFSTFLSGNLHLVFIEYDNYMAKMSLCCFRGIAAVGSNCPFKLKSVVVGDQNKPLFPFTTVLV
jgi:hypothetical protein